MSELDSLSAGASRREFFRKVLGAGTVLAVASGKGVGPTFSAAQVADVDSVVSFPSIRELHAFRQRLPHGQPVNVKGSLFEWIGASLVPLGPVTVKAFAATGDGETDDTDAILAAVEMASRYHKPVFFPAGTYRCSSRIALSSGAYGDGPESTIIQAVNDGGRHYNFFHIIGSGLYEGLTVDGAVSDDPAEWTDANHDSFNGWGAIGVSANHVIVRNCVARNSWRANVRCELANHVALENLKVTRSRGVYGDGFYFQRSHFITLENCHAHDHTRIGFVCEGGASSAGIDRITQGVTFIGCKAEYGHDQSRDYGGREFNTGFWFENATQISCYNCIALDQRETGFRFSGTSRILTDVVARSTAQFSFIDCYARYTSVGFQGTGIDEDAMGHVTFTGCVSDGNDQGFGCNLINARLDNCSYFHSGGGQQARAVSTGKGSIVTVDGFFEQWTDRPDAVHDPELDAGSVSTFSSNLPRDVTVRNYRTQDGRPAIIKYRVTSDQAVTLRVENTTFSTPRLMAQSTFLDCVIHDAGWVEAIKAEGCEFIDFSGNANALVANNCRFSRSNERNRLLYIYSRHASSEPFFLITNSLFIGDLENGAEFVFVNSSAGLEDVSRAHDLYLNGCVFHNTGKITNNCCINLKRSAKASRVVAMGSCRSSGIRFFTARDDQLVGEVFEI